MLRSIAPFLAVALVCSPSGAGAQLPMAETATPLAFSEFFGTSTRLLAPSAKLLSLDGKRVRIAGYMAKMELPPIGAFYLVPTPVANDEGGGGTGDLPPSAVRVVVRSATGRPVGFVPVPLEVTGVLEVGYREEPDGSVSRIRLVLDREVDQAAPAAPTAPSK